MRRSGGRDDLNDQLRQRRNASKASFCPINIALTV